MSKYGHYNHQYFSSVEFPTDSFLIAGISFFTDNCVDLTYNTILDCVPEVNEYDPTSICIVHNNKKIGYVPKKSINVNSLNVNSHLKIINIQKIKGYYGVRVMPIYTN